MKTIKIILTIVTVLTTIKSVNAQFSKADINNHTKTQDIRVYGECLMCKKRIEKAASNIVGVEYANWNENTKKLNVRYNIFKKEAIDNVQKKIASVGHDTEKYSADDLVYEQLPDCCHYLRKPKNT